MGVCLLFILPWSTAIEWEWSFIDDPVQKRAVNEMSETYGLVPGALHYVRDQAVNDWSSWGLFRPLYYVYTAVFYQTTPAIAHGLRLAMLLIVVLAPALVFARRQEGGYRPLLAAWALCLLLANTTLYQGLTFLSLQELTGLAFAALGLATSNRYARSLLWLCAAWMKTPFVWLFLAWGLFLLLARRPKLGVAVLAAGVATVLAAAVAARAGTYSSNFVISAPRMAASAREAISLFYWPGLIGVFGLLALRPRPTTIAWSDPITLVLASGGVLYLANLLPWGNLGVYYASPAVWMLSAAAIRLVASAQTRPWSGQWRPLTAAVLVVTIAATGYLVTKILRLQLQRNEAVVNLRNFALGLPEPRPIIGINGPEAAHRLHEIVLFHRPDWAGTIVYIDPANTDVAPDYYVTILDQSGINPRLTQNPVHAWPAATVYDP